MFLAGVQSCIRCKAKKIGSEKRGENQCTHKKKANAAATAEALYSAERASAVRLLVAWHLV